MQNETAMSSRRVEKVVDGERPVEGDPSIARQNVPKKKTSQRFLVQYLLPLSESVKKAPEDLKVFTDSRQYLDATHLLVKTGTAPTAYPHPLPHSFESVLCFSLLSSVDLLDGELAGVKALAGMRTEMAAEKAVRSIFLFCSPSHGEVAFHLLETSRSSSRRTAQARLREIICCTSPETTQM